MSTDLRLSSHPGFHDVFLYAAFDELRDAEHELTFARDRVTDAKARLRTALVAAAADLRASGEPPPLELIDELYWDVPAVRVGDIALAFGMTAVELRALVRPRAMVVDCRGCGQTMRALRASRSGGISNECDDCEVARRQRTAIANAIAAQRAQRDGLEWPGRWDSRYDDERVGDDGTW